jgi:hypothetical protein
LLPAKAVTILRYGSGTFSSVMARRFERRCAPPRKAAGAISRLSRPAPAWTHHPHHNTCSGSRASVQRWRIMLRAPHALTECAPGLRTRRALLPTTKPLTVSDRLQYLRLFAAARSRPRFPATPLQRRATHAFDASGLVITSDQTRRFGYSIGTPAGVDRFIESWYRPDQLPDLAECPRRRHGSLTSIGVPLRRVVAHPTRRSNPNSQTSRTSVLEPRDRRSIPRDA